MFELPLFPLNTVLFPGMPLQLHVFEERYRVMMRRVLTTNQTFGVNLIRSGAEALGPLPLPYEVGCTARVVSAEPLGDGRLNLTVVGDERFRIVRMGSGDPYLTAFVESLPIPVLDRSALAQGVGHLRVRVKEYLQILAQATAQSGQAEEGGLAGAEGAEEEGSDSPPTPPPDLSALQLPEDPLMMLFMAAALLQVPSQEKQPVLEAAHDADMLNAVQRLYRRELAVLPPLLEVSEEQARLSAWVN